MGDVGDVGRSWDWTTPSGGGAVGDGLKPPGRSALEPIGIPTLPTAATLPIPLGEDADAAGFDATDPPSVEQPPDAVPVLARPSNSAVGLDMLWVTLGPAEPPPQPALLPLIVPGRRLPAIGGLMPGDVIWVAPNGTPTGPTGAVGPSPSGDVIPIDGVVVGSICANAGSAPKGTAMNRSARALIVLRADCRTGLSR
jgi:hypothetical protein